MRIMEEKALTAKNYATHIALLDMSRAFDTVNRYMLLESLSNVIDPDELHIISILVQDTVLRVRCGTHTGIVFNTNMGVAQGDALSPILFTYYLSKALEALPNRHNVASEHFEIDIQYADDISWIANTMEVVDSAVNNIPTALEAWNLHVNETKTERHVITRNGNNNWQKCKYLGSLLDVNEDTKRRKHLALTAYNNTKRLLESIILPLQMRIRLFNALVGSVYLYNSETWTLTRTAEKGIDSFHRSLLRRVLGIHWPDTMTTQEVYNVTKETPWSSIIRQRRCRLMGHLLRLPPDTPVRKAISEGYRATQMPPGRRRTTWLVQIIDDLQSVGIVGNMDSLVEQACIKRF